MNERIRELALQAGFAHEPNKDQLWVSGPTEVMISPGLEKFAELIVEEVYDYILNATFDNEPWPSRKDVKQHFGVEE
jgi:hypothetical protein